VDRVPDLSRENTGTISGLRPQVIHKPQPPASQMSDMSQPNMSQPRPRNGSTNANKKTLGKKGAATGLTTGDDPY